jgi:hypothetical protein
MKDLFEMLEDQRLEFYNNPKLEGYKELDIELSELLLKLDREDDLSSLLVADSWNLKSRLWN